MTTIVVAFGLLVVTLVVLVPMMRREFFPEVDSGAFEIAAARASGTRIEVTEKLVEQVENYIRKTIERSRRAKDDLQDWSSPRSV